ncbi:MAG: putative inorganic carbon (HCO3(-)) transporter, partial [Candidatus Omnitrophota bacterium]
MLISAVFSPFNTEEFLWRGVFKWVRAIWIFLMMSEYFQDRRRRNRFAYSFLIGAALACLNGLYQMTHATDLIKGFSAYVPGRFARMQSSFSSPNDFSSYLLLVLPFSFLLWYRSRQKLSFKGLRRLILFVLIAGCLVATLSRSAMIGLVASLLLFLLSTKNFKILLYLCIGAGIVLISSPDLRYNFVTSLNLSDITVGERLHFWAVALEMIQNRPLLGFGPNTFFNAFDAYAPADLAYRGYAHNCFLQIWCDIGLVGLVLFIIPLFLPVIYMFRAQVQNTRRRQWIYALTIGVVAFSIQSAFDTNFFAL